MKTGPPLPLPAPSRKATSYVVSSRRPCSRLIAAYKSVAVRGRSVSTQLAGDPVFRSTEIVWIEVGKSRIVSSNMKKTFPLVAAAGVDGIAGGGGGSPADDGAGVFMG